MSIWKKWKEFPDDSDDQVHSESQDLILDEALKNFKLSVDSWSESAYSTRRIVESAPRRNWRPAAAWALGCALVASSVSGVVYKRHEVQLKAKQDAENRLVAQQKQAADLQTADEENLLASVDSDVSRQVPSAMEPLAQMAEDDSK
jgi:hypothetical protein